MKKMVTIYDLLEVDEKASKEEIEKSYQRLVIEYQTNPALSDEENQKNEMILNKFKMAFEILINDEKRKKYDMDLSKKRAEELIKKIPNRNQEESAIENNNIEEKSELYNKNEEILDSNDESLHEEIEYDEIPKAKNTRFKEPSQEDEVELSKEEQKKIRKAAQKEFNENLKKAQKAEEEYNNAYNQAYRKYMKKMGFETKEPGILKKLRNILIAIIVVSVICSIAWIIPPIRKILVNTYEDNIIIKSLFDIIGSIFKSI